MKTRAILLAMVALLAFWGSPAKAVDYGKIDRTIATEPKYHGQPQYCLVVFGVDASTRVWLVLDGEHLYVDRNANGDLTEADERLSLMELGKAPRYSEALFAFETRITIAAANAKYELQVLAAADADGRWGMSFRSYPVAGDDVSQWTEGTIPFSGRPNDAAIIHITEPWTLTLMAWGGKLDHNKLIRGEQRSLSILFGGPVVGTDGKAFVRTRTSLRKLQDGAFPTVEVELPPSTQGGAPITVQGEVRY